jgi:hypothetical protein
MNIEKLVVRPYMYRQFGDARGVTFCLVTNTALLDKIEVQHGGEYTDYRVYEYDSEDQMDLLLREVVPEPAHVLVVSPMRFFRSPSQEIIGQKRKLIAMACNSTPTSLTAVAHFLLMLERTRPDLQQSLVDNFLERARKTESMQIVDDVYGTRATFAHMDENYEWNIQAGTLDWGEQQIAPSGEVSVLPGDIWEFRTGRSMAIDGDIALRGLPILHSGSGSFLREDQRRIFESLVGMTNSAVVASIHNGVIVDLKAPERSGEKAAAMLGSLFSVDSRYRTLLELGFAVNTTLELLEDNLAMNEVYGGSCGCIHFGLGLTPHTQYHMDFICPQTKVLAANGELLFGGAEAQAISNL